MYYDADRHCVCCTWYAVGRYTAAAVTHDRNARDRIIKETKKKKRNTLKEIETAECSNDKRPRKKVRARKSVLIIDVCFDFLSFFFPGRFWCNSNSGLESKRQKNSFQNWNLDLKENEDRSFWNRIFHKIQTKIPSEDYVR